MEDEKKIGAFRRCGFRYLGCKMLAVFEVKKEIPDYNSNRASALFTGGASDTFLAGKDGDL
jgi:hypothetical protein